MFIDNLIRTLITVGAILIAGLIIASRDSWVLNAAIVAVVLGLFCFVLAAQFLVTIEMEDSETVAANDKAKDRRLAIPFLLGYLAYIVAGVCICVHFIGS